MFKRIYLALIILPVSFSIVAGQDYSREYGKISKYEAEMEVYPLDKDAEAVVLYDMAKTYFAERDASFDVVFERATKIKILSDAGIKWAEVEIPFYQEGQIYEKIYDIEAVTYNIENGMLVKTPLDVSNTFIEKKNNYWNVKKFALPNVRKGSVIEYRYKINSQYVFNFRDWSFQWRIPVAYSEYIAKMIPFYEYTYIMQGAKKFDVMESYEDSGSARHFGPARAYGDNAYNDMVYKFAMKNVPAFGDEEYITSINDYIIKIDFQLSKIHHLNGTTIPVMTTWEEMIKDLLKHADFGKFIDKSEKLASKVINVAEISGKPEEDKFNLVVDYVKSNYNWNNSEDKYASKSPNNLIDDKYGNCADINLFTVGLLRSVGIEAYPVILSTRDHGKIKSDYPFSHFFNYTIVMAKINNEIVLTDATEVLGMNERIPSKCINDVGLIIKKDKTEWANLNCKYASTIKTFVNIELDDKDLFVDLTKTATEYDALYFRHYYSGKTDAIKQKLSKSDYSIIDSTIAVKNQLDKKSPYILKYCYTTNPEIVNDKLYLSPFMQEIFTDNPFKQRERKYPVDMIYPAKRIFYSTLIIPDGYQVEYLPKDVKIDNDLFEITYNVTSYEGKIHIVFGYFFKSSLYGQADYTRIKNCFDTIIKQGNEKVVLKRNGETGN